MIFGRPMTNSSCDFLYLHGFWGKGLEAPEFLAGLKELGRDGQVLAPNLMVTGPLGPENGFAQWAENVRQWLAVQRNSVNPLYLVGYSMGGRLGMHLLAHMRSEFSGAIFLSTHTGLMTAAEVLAREQWQEQWTERFMQWPWSDLQAAWGQQEVFSGHRVLQRDCNLPREILAQALINWSVLKHQVTAIELKSVACPQLWLYGETDKKYVDLAERWCAEEAMDKAVIIPGGHRLPFESARTCLRQIEAFIS